MNETPLNIKKLFDENATDDNIRIFNGETTNLLNLENIKYQWCHDIFDAIYANNWLPHKVSMGKDKAQWKDLTEHEQNAYKDIISFLVFLDSIQTNNLPNISDYVTAPDVVYVLARQTYDEAIHSKSYGWIGSSIFSHTEFKKIVYKWREGGVLKERFEQVTNGYEEFLKNPTNREFIRVLIKNYLLEGLYFYNGFQFFHNLSSRGLMIGTDTQITYIQRDEIQHCNIFKHTMLEVQKEEPELWADMEDEIYELFREAVDMEILFSSTVIGDNILGMTTQSITDYAHFLANKRLKDIKLTPIFPKAKNPYKHLEMMAGVEDETTKRANNFEITSINYKNASILDGWEDL
jgi:ribonucleoside-diphosphate reductase beta chain